MKPILITINIVLVVITAFFILVALYFRWNMETAIVEWSKDKEELTICENKKNQIKYTEVEEIPIDDTIYYPVDYYYEVIAPAKEPEEEPKCLDWIGWGDELECYKWEEL